ncbi:hypothetical protein P4O66_002861 [Electrophorus voltai]|uniref:Reverse transcriptase RNase H-like domain-containing protein n=1 Tax=Electrophorus voltai TaxID=2609070 RepID=A0AAD8YWT0_9TELE|nr:hypothetical protein P4O66_002861 [Electrophorus voltai]
MDPAKLRAVENWSRPILVRLVQRFLGFTNFYRRFVRNFNMVAAPLIALTRKASGRFCWSIKLQQAFEELKRYLTTAPILQLPDAELPFLVEVDASEHLSPAERNYDMGNGELLAVELMLEEWRHWLEGAKHPFLVWMDHKNLAYIQQAKQLNPHQAKWGLFFARFDITLSYRLSTKNAKPDALSHQWESSLPSAPPLTVIPRARIGGLRMQYVRPSLLNQSEPGGGPSGAVVCTQGG